MSYEPYSQTPTIMPGGTFTTGAEIHASGAQAWQSDFEKEQSVQRHRTQQMVNSLNPSGYNPYAGASSGSGSPNGSGRGLVALLCIGVVAFVAFTFWSNARVSMPWHFGVFQNRALAIDAKSVAVLRNMNQETYKNLFTDGAPLADLFKGCRFKNCTEPDWPAFKRMLPYARNPAAYEHDICTLLFSRQSHAYPDSLIKPMWTMGAALEPKFNANTCMLVNKEAVWKGVQRHRLVTNITTGVGAALAIALLMFGIFRTKPKAG